MPYTPAAGLLRTVPLDDRDAGGWRVRAAELVVGDAAGGQGTRGDVGTGGRASRPGVVDGAVRAGGGARGSGGGGAGRQAGDGDGEQGGGDEGPAEEHEASSHVVVTRPCRRRRDRIATPDANTPPVPTPEAAMLGPLEAPIASCVVRTPPKPPGVPHTRTDSRVWSDRVRNRHRCVSRTTLAPESVRWRRSRCQALCCGDSTRTPAPTSTRTRTAERMRSRPRRPRPRALPAHPGPERSP